MSTALESISSKALAAPSKPTALAQREASPMEFVPVSYSKEEKRKTRKILAGVISLGTGVATFPTGLTLLDGVVSTAEVVFPALGIAAFILTAIASSFVPGIREGTRKAARDEGLRAALNLHYGLRISSEDFAGLSYPYERPSSDFEVFGSILHQERVSESSFVELKFYLVWMGGKFQLSESRDGKRFKELKPARLELAATSQKTALGERPAFLVPQP